MKLILLGLSVAILSGTFLFIGANRALDSAGYSQIQITGFRFFGCGEDDNFRTGFAAVGPTGKPVTGVVCGGFLKGSTIRLD